MTLRPAHFLSTLLLLPLFARAQSGPPPTRDLRRFDFEERELGNAEDLPMHWVKIEARGYPHYVAGRLATDRARSGQYSFRFDLNGGSIAYRYEPARIRVQPGAHYHVESFVQTTPLPNARARLTAYFIDADNRTIRNSIRHSDLFVQPPADSHWHPISVDVSADKLAHHLVVELALLQPAQYAPGLLGDKTVFPQDIRGTAWFDDLSVSQIPRVSLSTDKPANIFRSSDDIILAVELNDRFLDDLSAQLRVTDGRGQSVYQRSGAHDLLAAESLGPNHKRLTLAIPPLAAGWYRASLVMASSGHALGRPTLDFIVLSDDAHDHTPDPRFGVVATHLPFHAWRSLPAVLPRIGVGRVKLPLWSRTTELQQSDAPLFDELLLSLRDQRIIPTACLIDLPPSVSRKVHGDSWLHLLKAPPEDWQPQLAYLVSRHANYLEHWQLGADGSDVFVQQPRMREVYDLLHRQFATLMQKPDLAIPWPAWQELPPHIPSSISLSVHPSILPSQLPLYMQDIAQRAGQNLSLSLQPLDADRYGREVQINDYAQRLICALAGNAHQIDLPLPLTAAYDGNQLVERPQELLLILRTIVTTLGHSRCLGKVNIADGVEGYLFDRNGTSILALWDKGSRPGLKPLALTLGQSPRLLDLWGNVTPLLSPQPHSAQHSALSTQHSTVRLTLGPTPIFLIDIDGHLAQLRASVAIDQPLIESSFRPHQRKIRFTNPYPQAITGSLKLKAPQGWTLAPASILFSLNPGETLTRELVIEFPYNSFGGPKTIDAHFELQTDRPSFLSVPVQLVLGLSDVGTQTLALRDGKDIIVQQLITNYGDAPVNYTAFAAVPGLARQERLVTNLAPGRSTMKIYRFPNAMAPKAGKLRAGVKELEGTRILNDEVEIN